MRKLIIAAILLLFSISARAADIDPSALFSKPETLKKPNGDDFITGKAMACPFPYDWSGDGVIDLVIGAKEGMGTARGGIWLVKNQGTNEKPAFDMDNAIRVSEIGKNGEEIPVKIGCG